MCIRDRRQPVVDLHQTLGKARLVVGNDRAAGHMNEPIALNVDQAPAGAAEAGIDAQDANRSVLHALVYHERGGLASGGAETVRERVRRKI